jgi:hypothetical protein
MSKNCNLKFYGLSALRSPSRCRFDPLSETKFLVHIKKNDSKKRKWKIHKKKFSLLMTLNDLRFLLESVNDRQPKTVVKDKNAQHSTRYYPGAL